MRRILMSLTVVALLFIPQFAAADDVADLKAAHTKLFQAVSSLDADTVASMAYPGMVLYGPEAAFPNVMPMEDIKTQLAQGLKQWFSNLEYWEINPYNMQYRVIGNVGLVWGHQTQNQKVKGEPSHRLYLRVTQTWIKENGKWYAVTNHASVIPSGD